MNVSAAYINQAMTPCGGRRVFVPRDYGYNASERIILGQQSKGTRDCYWLMAQEQNLQCDELGSHLQPGYFDTTAYLSFHDERGLIIPEGAPTLFRNTYTWETTRPGGFLRPTYRM